MVISVVVLPQLDALADGDTFALALGEAVALGVGVAVTVAGRVGVVVVVELVLAPL
jgi:hypothetical protein